MGVLEFSPKTAVQLPLEYGPLYGGKENVRFFLNPFQATEETNQNQADAGRVIKRVFELRRARGGEGLVINVVGPMGAGKSTVAYLIGMTEESVDFFKQQEDVKRFGRNIGTQGGLEIKDVGIFKDLDELQEQIQSSPAEIIVAEELQFSGGANEGRERIEAFIHDVKAMGKDLVETALDFDFRREEWPNTKHMVDLADATLVLAARCTECGKPATFTIRKIDGEPAHEDDPVVMVGSVVEDVYFPACPKHHLVLPPRKKRQK